MPKHYNDKKEKKEVSLGSGMAENARQALKSRKSKLEEAEKAAMGESRPSMSKKWTE